MTNQNQSKPTPKPTPKQPAAPAKTERVHLKIRTYPGNNGQEVGVVGGLFLWDPQVSNKTVAGQPTQQLRAPKLTPGQVISVPKHIADTWMRDPNLRKKLEITYEDVNRPVVFDTPQEAKAMMPGRAFGRSPEGQRLKRIIAEKLAAGKYPDWPTEDNPSTVTGLADEAPSIRGWADAQKG